MSSLSEVEHLQIPLQDILSATNNFDEKNFIAMGGFGSVYQGQSHKYGTIAVKRLSVGSDQGQHEFAMEIKLLSAYKHENLASLVGFCDQDGQKILVYKLESKGSLDKHLKSKDLNWIQRLRICLDAAHGLKYLHNDVGPQHRVVHRDIKSANILLDDKLKAKISDFGLSKVNPVNGPFTILISNACGTIGYVDPEYVIYGVLTENSDVYSFGVVLFEVLCGRPAQVVSYKDKRQFLCILAQNHYQKDTLDEIIDSELRKQMNSASLTIFSTIAYQCLKSREDRPTITRVVEQLQKALDYQLLASSGLGRDAKVSFRDQDVYNNIRDRSRLTASSQSTLVSSSPSWNHDVFVSFSGTDVGICHNFLDHLNTALVQKGIHTYMDGNYKMPEQCESIPPSRLKVIKESRIVLVIFSNNYANSSWCLNELAYVMENKNEIGQTVIPMFYEVYPSNVRKQSGAFGRAFAIHDSNVNKAESWRKALSDAGSLTGWPLRDVMNMNGLKFIKEIVDTISRRLLPSMIMPSVNGSEIRTTPIQDLKSQLQVGFGGVCMVGICGIWGSGKSSLASAVYEEIRHEFEGCCFVKNVRDESRMHGLKTLQEKILSNILEPREVVLESIEEGISMMKSRLRHTCVLIVLDDVDHLDHLEMLAGSQDWFGTGSRIIITTRNKNLLIAHNINIIHNVRPLYTEEAIELFSRHAFDAHRPVEGYEELSRNLVYKSGGHPSTLVRLGSFLQGKDHMMEWSRTLARLEDLSVQEIVELFNPGDDGVVRRPW